MLPRKRWSGESEHNCEYLGYCTNERIRSWATFVPPSPPLSRDQPRPQCHVVLLKKQLTSYGLKTTSTNAPKK